MFEVAYLQQQSRQAYRAATALADMEEGLEATEDEKALDIMSVCEHIIFGYTYDVNEDCPKDCASNGVTILRVLFSAQHCVATGLEERSNGG